MNKLFSFFKGTELQQRYLKNGIILFLGFVLISSIVGALL